MITQMKYQTKITSLLCKITFPSPLLNNYPTLLSSKFQISYSFNFIYSLFFLTLSCLLKTSFNYQILFFSLYLASPMAFSNVTIKLSSIFINHKTSTSNKCTSFSIINIYIYNNCCNCYLFYKILKL